MISFYHVTSFSRAWHRFQGCDIISGDVNWGEKKFCPLWGATRRVFGNEHWHYSRLLLFMFSFRTCFCGRNIIIFISFFSSVNFLIVSNVELKMSKNLYYCLWGHLISWQRELKNNDKKKKMKWKRSRRWRRSRKIRSCRDAAIIL